MTAAGTLRRQVADLFYNYRFDRIDLDRHDELVILTVLRLGTWDQIMATFRYYGWERVKQVVGKDFFGYRSLPEAVRSFWGNVFWPDVPLPEQLDPLDRWRPTRAVPDGVALPRPTVRGPSESPRDRSLPAGLGGCSRDLPGLPRQRPYLSGSPLPLD